MLSRVADAAVFAGVGAGLPTCSRSRFPNGSCNQPRDHDPHPQRGLHGRLQLRSPGSQSAQHYEADRPRHNVHQTQRKPHRQRRTWDGGGHRQRQKEP